MRILWRMSRRSVTSLVSFKTRVLCGKAFVTLPIVIIESHYSCNVSRFIDGHQAFLQEIDLTWLIIVSLGTVKSLEIPRPRAGQDVTGVGKIFVEFTDTDGCNKGRFLILITYYCVIVVFFKTFESYECSFGSKVCYARRADLVLRSRNVSQPCFQVEKLSSLVIRRFRLNFCPVYLVFTLDPSKRQL